MDFYKGDIPVLDDDSPVCRDVLRPDGVAFGAVPRDWAADPIPMGADLTQENPSGIRVYDESEWDALYDEQEANESSLEHIYLRGGKPAFTNLDQNRDGDCWAYSTGHAWMLARLRDNLPPLRCNPHFVAAFLRRFDGGWCGASAEVLNRVGILTEGTGPDQWPLWSHDTRLLTPARLEAAKRFRSTEQWFDISRPVHGQRMTSRQLATCGLNNIPAPSDFNWWTHSVCQVRWVRIERGSWGPLIINSWKGWGRHGLAVLRGRQAVADGAVAIRSVLPTAA